MARSPLTLAATVTSALPQAVVTAVGSLTEGAAGRYDTAVADLDDGRRVVIRVPVDTEASNELAAEARALHALTPGVRSLLPFRAPELLGETSLDQSRVLVVDLLEGYRVDAADIPAGRGVATSVGAALAALHTLPLSVVRTEGLPVRTPSQVRDDVSRLIDRVEATRRAPAALIGRWRRAASAEELWRFESAVTLGGATATSFLFDEIDDAPGVVGVLEWHGLQVGDPAVDLQWLAGAPDAADDVFDAYASASGRAPDGLVRERARMYAELEFARWLVHGYETGSEDIVDDAVELLEALAGGVGNDDVVPRTASSVDEALALLDRTPEAPAPAVDTSMHTDTYDPEELSAWLDGDGDGRATTDLGDAVAPARAATGELFDRAPEGDSEPTGPGPASTSDEDSFPSFAPGPPAASTAAGAEGDPDGAAADHDEDRSRTTRPAPTSTEEPVPTHGVEPDGRQDDAGRGDGERGDGSDHPAPLWSDISFRETAPIADDPPAPITEADLPPSRPLRTGEPGSDAARRAATRRADDDPGEPDDAAEAQRASDAALRRWLAD
ncbi:phosphotransferase [Microbacterium aquimaris]|uniref:Aminoglycoside phosphotransferase n=1 Tax=Microbacterium aquimaris TaxID=459816 RepID=A0ABU5N7E9_9MICO|nr:phosphotransferase [Microbacterium aquimaris]MDZ8161946.1 aminoglycoside phosphotransferase [Microbacterium aquimaris]